MSAESNEQRILEQLCIENNGNPVVIFTQSAHLDYDWVRTFYQYLRYYEVNNEDRSVITILKKSLALMAQHVAAECPEPRYYDSLATVDFLRAGLAEIDGGLAALQQLQEVFCTLGAGLVTPDDLVSNGEAFLRNYLLGNKWAAENLPQARSPQAWLPDNFGHSSQLPVVLEAMGMNGVGFARIPGADMQNASHGPLAGELLKEGLGFRWIASDGSEVTTYWMPHGYNQGAPQSNADIENRIEANVGQYEGSALEWRYMQVPIGDDFALPDENLLSVLAGWQGSPQYPKVRVVMANFDLFIQLLASHPELLLTRGPGQAKLFNPTPYWTGWYASQPAIKRLHQEATRALLGAETLAAIASLRPNYVGSSTLSQELESAWSLLAPTTSHNIITGCSPDLITQAQQIPMLERARVTAEALQDGLLQAVAASVNVMGDNTPTPDATDYVVVFNPLGFESSVPRLVEIPPDPERDLTSYTHIQIDGTTRPVQATYEGGLIFQSHSAPSLGYTTARLVRGTPTPPPPIPPNMVRNELLTARLGVDGSLVSLLDVHGGGAELIGPGSANRLELWRDAGNIYRFANEEGTFGQPVGDTFENSGVSLSTPQIEVLESGPVRQRIRATATATVAGRVYTYVREYAAVAGEPFLRLRTTGRAPNAESPNIGYSVMAAFTFAQPFDRLEYGTAYHWDDYVPDGWGDGGSYPFWEPPIFLPTHDFLAPSGDEPVPALYHGSVHAWAPILGTEPSMTGFRACLLRNVPGGPGTTGYGADGTDKETHTLDYAIRVPTGFQPAGSGLPLREARAFQTPLPVAWLTPAYRDDQGRVDHPRFMKTTYALATPDDNAAIITAAKPGTIDPGKLVLRLYQPTNGPLAVSVAVDPSPLRNTAGVVESAEAGSALEQEFSGPGYTPPEWPAVTVNGARCSLTMHRAIATLTVARSEAPECSGETPARPD